MSICYIDNYYCGLELIVYSWPNLKHQLLSCLCCNFHIYILLAFDYYIFSVYNVIYEVLKIDFTVFIFIIIHIKLIYTASKI